MGAGLQRPDCAYSTHIYMQTARQADGHTAQPTDRTVQNRQTDGRTDRPEQKKLRKQSDRQRNRQTDRQTERWTAT